MIFKKYNLENTGKENINQFLLNKQDKNYSSQTINLYLNAIKFFYRRVLKMSQRINLNDYLFESERGGKLTERTAQKVFENALRGTSVRKDATFHSLRRALRRIL